MIFSIFTANCINKVMSYKLPQYFRWRYLAVRNLSTQITKLSNEEQSQKRYIRVFEMPTIRVYRVISRLKLYQTAVTVMLFPPSMYLHYINVLENFHITAATVGIAGCLTFYSTSFILNNLVGAVYVDEALDTVKVAYIGFWGQRIETICSKCDIVPLTNQPIKNRIFKLSLIKLNSSSQTFKIAIDHGAILQRRAFDEVFFRVDTKIGKNSPPSHEEK